MKLRGHVRTSVDVPWLNLGKLDLAWGGIAPCIVLLIRSEHQFDHDQIVNSLIYIGVSIVVTSICSFGFRINHRVSRYFSVDDAIAIFLSSAIAVTVTVLICFLWIRLDNIPRSVPVLHFLALALGNISVRMLRYKRYRRRDRPMHSAAGVQNIIVIGVSDLSWHYMQIVDHLMPDLYHFIAFLDDDKNLQGRYVHGHPVAGRIRHIASVLEEYELHGVEIHRLILSSPLTLLPSETKELLLREAEKRQIKIDVLPERLGLADPVLPFSAVPEVDQPSYQPDSPFWNAKRKLDVSLATAALILTAPLAAVVCLLVFLDCGMPIYFWQVRIGRYGQKIAVYKFRTLKALYDREGLPIPPSRRLSWIGQLLRRTHLDELPQLISVVSGDMSLIGPRPLLPIDMPKRFDLRNSVRPGITGWAQVNGATLVSPEEKNAMDEWYVRHACWSLECKIVLKTFYALFSPMQRNEDVIAEALQESDALREPDTEQDLQIYAGQS